MKWLYRLLYIYTFAFAYFVSAALLYYVVFHGWHAWGLVFLLPVDLFLLLIFFKWIRNRNLTTRREGEHHENS